jgi:hypothetical protein
MTSSSLVIPSGTADCTTTNLRNLHCCFCLFNWLHYRYSAKLRVQLEQMVAHVRTNLEKNERTKINTMLIIDVHARDIVDSFVRDSIMEAREFEWESQLRFYWDKEEDDLLVRP